MPKVSIVVPLYKSEKYMVKCIESILTQTMRDIEVILVNDGSPDRCGEIAEVFKQKDSRVKVLHQKNGGPSAARNAGIAIAKGEFIGFVDPDDWVAPDMFEDLYTIANANGADMAICNFNTVNETGINFNHLNIKAEVIDIEYNGLEEYYYNYFLIYSHGHAIWNKIYRRSIIDIHNIKFEKSGEVFAEDLLFNLYYLCHTKIIRTTGSSYYNYFLRENSIMNSIESQLPLQYINLVDNFVIYIEKSGQLEEIKNIPPVLLYMLLRRGISHLLSHGFTRDVIKSIIKNAYQSKYFRSLMGQLAFGNTPNIYCGKTKQGIKTNVFMRLYALSCYCKSPQGLRLLVAYELLKSRK